MAITDIRINVSLPTNRKYRWFKRRIGVDALEYLVLFWIRVAQQSPSGELGDWSSSDVEDAAEWRGDPGVLFNALRDCGFLDVDDGAITVHDWHEHQSWVVRAPERSEVNRRNVGKRWAREREAEEARLQAQEARKQKRLDRKNKGPQAPSDALHGGGYDPDTGRMGGEYEEDTGCIGVGENRITIAGKARQGKARTGAFQGAELSSEARGEGGGSCE